MMRLPVLPDNTSQKARAIEVALGLVLSCAIWLAWVSMAGERLPFEAAWFALGWAIILTMPASLRPFIAGQDRIAIEQPMRYAICWLGPLCLAGSFLLILICHSYIGAYKLLLGAVYVVAVSMSLGVPALCLRARLLSVKHQSMTDWAFAALISATGGLIMSPWLRPDLLESWPPAPLLLLDILASCLLWGAIAGGVAMNILWWRRTPRHAWIAFLATGIGLGPALAIAWFKLSWLATALGLVGGLAMWRMWSHKDRPLNDNGRGELPLYWLMRGIMLLWWTMGLAIILATAWWQPRLDLLFLEAEWLRALLLGGFVVGCFGALAEYILPLLGAGEAVSVGARSKWVSWGLSILVFLLSLSALGLIDPAAPKPLPGGLARPRAVIFEGRKVLEPQDSSVSFKVPGWLSGVSRIWLVCHLADGAQVPHNTVVAQMVATDLDGLPHIFQIRAGIDTAVYDMERKKVLFAARHDQASTESKWRIHDATGQSFWGRNFYTGYFFRGKVDGLEKIIIRYLYTNPEGEEPVKLVITKLVAE